MVPEAGLRRLIFASLVPAPAAKVKMDSCSAPPENLCAGSALVREGESVIMSGGAGDGIWPCF